MRLYYGIYALSRATSSIRVTRLMKNSFATDISGSLTTHESDGCKHYTDKQA